MVSFSSVKLKAKEKPVKQGESFTPFKKELIAMSFEPLYGRSIKEILIRLTSLVQEIASSYGYEVEFSPRFSKILDGDSVYFEFPVTVKGRNASKKLKLGLKATFYEEGRWVGMLVDVKP